MNSALDIPDNSVLTEVLSTVAADRERKGEPGADPLVLDPLADAIDPDLVADFVDSENVAPDSELRFEYADREVVVTGDGAVTVED